MAFHEGVSPVCAEYMLAAPAQSTGNAQRLAGVGTTLDAQSKALQLINEFATSLCNAAIPLNTTKPSVELTGQARAALSSLVSKVADVGITGTGRYKNEETMNVLQKDLAHTLEVGGDCKFKVFMQLKDKLLPDTTPTR